MKILNKDPFEEKNLSWIEKTEEKHIKVVSEPEMIEIINDEFNYEILDNETIDYLKIKEKEMQKIMTKTYTEMGKVLSEAQEKLSKSGYGCFLEWTKSLGLKKDKVYSLLNRYNLILSFGNSEKRNLVENIPLSLSYEISKKNVDEILKNKVLDGEIATLKEFRNYKKNDGDIVSEKSIVEKVVSEKIDIEKELTELILKFGVKKIKGQKIVKEILNGYKVIKK
jgi:hypothetical protein